MREIKFKFWLADIKRMTAPYTLKYILSHQNDYDPNKGIPTALQYTGLTDKNGKEIYEGDIVRTVSYSSSGAITGPVEWLEYRWDVPNFYSASQDCPGDAFSEAAWEIIGNIYETPHLLNNEK